MSEETIDNPRTVAVEQLERLGLTTYAARTFVGLVRLGTGTASDVSDVANVPRTRVYDAAKELQEWGLVDVKDVSPKEFWAISASTAGRTFERSLTHRTDLLQSALEEVEPVDRRSEQRGVWTVEGQPAVTDRVLDFLNGADEEIVYMTDEDLLTEDLVDALAAAADRGVSIELAGISAAVQERIQDRIPGANTFESLWVWSDTAAGRLMMVDRRTTLVSALVNGRDASHADPRSETAIWGRGEQNSLVVILKAIFTWRLGAADRDE